MSENSDNFNNQSVSLEMSTKSTVLNDNLPNDINIEYNDDVIEEETIKKPIKESVTVEDVSDDEVKEVSDSEDETLLNTQSVSKSKYTEIDHLDEDKPIKGQEFVCFSFVSPEGVMNTTLRSVKFRGAFATYELASAHAKKLQSKDKYFDVFVGEGGKFLPWDPDPHSVTNVKYADNKMQKLSDAQQKKQQDKLNELVGRKKELMDKQSKGHDRRVADQIVSGTNEEGGATVNNKSDKKEKTQKTQKPTQADRLEQIKARMRKKLEDRKNNKPLTDKPTNEDSLIADKDRQLKNVNARTEELNKDKEYSNKIEDNINKIKNFMASNK